MSHTDTVYNQDTPAKRQAQAIKDIKKWLKPKRYELTLVNITAAIAQERTLAYITMCLGIAGIQGYPVEAFCRHICDMTQLKLPVGLE